MDLGKTVLPENEIYGSWIKTLDPKQKSSFHCTFFTFLKNGTYVPPKHYQDKLQLYEQHETDHRQPQQAHIEISRHQ